MEKQESHCDLCDGQIKRHGIGRHEPAQSSYDGKGGKNMGCHSPMGEPLGSIKSPDGLTEAALPGGHAPQERRQEERMEGDRELEIRPKLNAGESNASEITEKNSIG